VAQLIADRQDMDFVLCEQFKADALTNHEKFADFNKKAFDLIITEARNLAASVQSIRKRHSKKAVYRITRMPSVKRMYSIFF
jgi:hypothetical protein